MRSIVLSYMRLFAGLTMVFLISEQSDLIQQVVMASGESHLLEAFLMISVVFALSFLIFYISAGTTLPSFVVAIFFGMVSQKLLHPVIEQEILLSEIVGLGATLILFGGGLETPWQNFKKLLAKIISLSFVGLLFTALGLSYVLLVLGNIFGVAIPVPVVVLLGAVLASTDPAAIIPILKQLRFQKRDTKDIIVSESAMTDVTGTLLTVVFLSLINGGIIFADVGNAYQYLLSAQTAEVLLRQIIFGVVFGIAGYGLLEALSHFKRGHEREFEVDAAYFLFVPVIIFTAALLMGGSGYLAAFVAGLLFVMTEKLHSTEQFFNQTIDGFLKPAIFLLLGALVDIPSLISYTGVGISAALIFMFLIRPLAVILSLFPFMLKKKKELGWREVLFIASVRETGAIPAVLLVTIVSLGLSGIEGLIPVGMWVILLTLIIQPPLTPLIARWLRVAEPIHDTAGIAVNRQHPFVVLGSRGNSYRERLPHVVEWASGHGIKQVMLLHCLEDKYTKERADETGIEAESEFARINRIRELRGQNKLKFSYICREGFLQKNIGDLSEEYKNLSAIFVGKKILDYNLADVKALAAPIFFID